MKLLLFIAFISIFSIHNLRAQCSVEVNDSLYANYDYVLNAINVTGQSPFQYNWTVTDGNGMPVPYTTSSTGDSITIESQTIQNSYGCIIYQLCMTDYVGCTTCVGDTSELQVPYACFSQFTSSIVGPNQVEVTMNSNIPPFLIMQQFLTWTDGNGAGQGMPYMGPGTVVSYTPGPNNTSDKFLLCMMTNLTTGGCISCDSIQYRVADIDEVMLQKLELYPNPTEQIINVSSDQEIDNLMIYSMSGILLMEVNVVENKEYQIDMNAIPTGVYLLEVISENGIHSKKLIIKK